MYTQYHRYSVGIKNVDQKKCIFLLSFVVALRTVFKFVFFNFNFEFCVLCVRVCVCVCVYDTVYIVVSKVYGVV